MISATANQFACFARLLLFGGLAGIVVFVVRKVMFLLSKENFFRHIVAIFCGASVGVLYIFLLLSFPHVKKSGVYSIVFCSGMYMGKYIIDTIVALFENLCYNRINLNAKHSKKRDVDRK